jgi:hypothetical protein
MENDKTIINVNCACQINGFKCLAITVRGLDITDIQDSLFQTMYHATFSDAPQFDTKCQLHPENSSEYYQFHNISNFHYPKSAS